MSKEYIEPELTIAILDYCKPIESHLLLESIKKHVKVPHKILFCDNGSGENYAFEFLKEGKIDQLLINYKSLGLGIGTRDLHALTSTSHILYCQNDQIFCNDLTEDYFKFFKRILNGEISTNEYSGKIIKSISLSGYPCGKDIFSERAFLMETAFYKSLEPLSLGGAGFLHELPWREGQIQELYKKNNWVHVAIGQYVGDNGVFATRNMREAGIWCHRTDLKTLFCIVKPSDRNPVYPKFSEAEWQLALSEEGWPDGKIPEIELKDSFDCWSNTLLGRMQEDYIKDLKRRFKDKK
jgi:hypothetical protein